jgi:hypothetical protein
MRSAVSPRSRSFSTGARSTRRRSTTSCAGGTSDRCDRARSPGGRPRTGRAARPAVSGRTPRRGDRVGLAGRLRSGRPVQSRWCEVGIGRCRSPGPAPGGSARPRRGPRGRARSVVDQLGDRGVVTSGPGRPETVSGEDAGCPNPNWTGVNPTLTVTDIELVIEQPSGRPPPTGRGRAAHAALERRHARVRDRATADGVASRGALK